MRYVDNPQAVEQATRSYVLMLREIAAEKGIKLSYNFDIMYQAALKVKINLQSKQAQKPTDGLSARTYVFRQRLTPEEQATVLKKNYLVCPEAAHRAMAQAGKFLAEELVMLNLIENTEEARAACAANFLQEKLKSFKDHYGK